MGLLEGFKKAAKEIAIDLEMNTRKLEIKYDETPKIGLDYFARLSEIDRMFEFHLSTETDEEDPASGIMKVSLQIYFRKDTPPYWFSENINYMKNHPEFLSRWASWAIYNFRQEHQKINLQSLFYNSLLRVYTEEEIDPLFYGILAIQEDNIMIYKFRHIRRDDLYRSFSYAVYVKPKTNEYYWAVFPNVCGVDSGGAYRLYKHFENMIEMIKQKLNVKIEMYNVDYNELKQFLIRQGVTSYPIFREESIDIDYLHSCPLEALKGSEMQYKKFVSRFEEMSYPQALRDLRALVQQALENIARLNNLDYSHIGEPNIKKLASFLIEKKKIEGRLLPWFEAFASIANIASHRDYPNSRDMEKQTLRFRILLTFYLGRQLIAELSATLRNSDYKQN